MQLSSKDGIACDFCGMTHKDDFEYNSIDAKAVSNSFHLSQRLSAAVSSSFDCCMSCLDILSKKILETNRKPSTNKCELSGGLLGRDFYYCVVTHVRVSISGRIVCGLCGDFVDNDTCSKCNNNSNFIKNSNVQTSSRILEFSICGDEYNRWLSKMSDVRRIAGEWSTKS